MLTVGDRVEIASGLKVGWSIRAIAEHIGRCPSVVSREVRRNATKTRGYKIVTADCRAQRRRARPQLGKVAADPVLRARVLGDLGRSHTPRQIAGRLHAEACGASVGPMKGSVPVQGRTVSHEAIYRFVYALPKGELARHGVMLRSRRTQRRRFKPVGHRRPPPRPIATYGRGFEASLISRVLPAPRPSSRPQPRGAGAVSRVTSPVR